MTNFWKTLKPLLKRLFLKMLKIIYNRLARPLEPLLGFCWLLIKVNLKPQNPNSRNPKTAYDSHI